MEPYITGCDHLFQLTIELIIHSVCLSFWSFYPHCALILDDALVRVQPWQVYLNKCQVTMLTWVYLLLLCSIPLIYSCGELTLCGNFSFRCANANYSRYYATFICVQLHKFMGVFQEDMLKIHQQPTLCRCRTNNHFN